MKSTFHPLALVGALLLGSCGKDEPSLTVAAGKYRGSNTLTASGPITLYTSAGAVSDPAIISRFISRQSAVPGFPAFASVDVPVSVGVTLSIYSDKSVFIGEAYRGQTSFASQADITAQAPHYVVLTQRDSAVLFVRGTGTCERFANDLLTVRPQQRCLDQFGSSNGTLQSCIYRNQRIIKEVNGQLFVPHLSWWLQRSAGASRCTSGGSGEWNLFNPAVLPQLAPGDTLLVQERQVALTKQ